MKSLFGIMLLLFSFIYSGFSNDIRMHMNKAINNIEEAKIKAAAEGKNIFVDFTAKWCAPCQWMEQTTFSDKNIITRLNQSFIRVKIDIDDVQGFEIKNQYNIKYLPTMMIFNAQGQILDRIEETVTAGVLDHILVKSISSYKVGSLKHEFNQSPYEKMEKNSFINDETFMSSDDFLRYFHQNLNQKVFKVKTAVFKDFVDASDHVLTLRNKYSHPVNVSNEIHDNQLYFTVTIGQFFTRNEAEQFKQMLKLETDIEGEVK